MLFYICTLSCLSILVIGLTVTPHLEPLITNTKPSAKNLAIVFVHHLNFNKHINSLVRTCYLQIKNIAKVKSMHPLPKGFGQESWWHQRSHVQRHRPA